MYDFFVEEATRVNNIEKFDYKQDLFNSFMEADSIISYTNNIFLIESISEANILKTVWDLLKKAFNKIIEALGIFCNKFKSLFSKDKKVVEAAKKAAKAPETEEMKKKEEASTAKFNVHSVSSNDRMDALNLADKVDSNEIYEYAKKNKSSDGLDQYILNKVDKFKTNRYSLAAQYIYFPEESRKEYSLSEAKANTDNFVKQFDALGHFNMYFFKGYKKNLDSELATAKKLFDASDEIDNVNYYNTCFNKFTTFKREVFRGINNAMIMEYKELKKVLTAIAAVYIDFSTDLDREPESYFDNNK